MQVSFPDSAGLHIVKSKGFQPTAAMRKWQDDVRQFGCVATGADPAHCQLHHVHGATYKHNKVLIGPWFILPLHHKLHDIRSNDPRNVTNFPAAFTLKYGPQHMLFLKMITTMLARGIELPFPMEVLNAIMQTKR